MDPFAQFLAGFQAYMNNTPQEVIDARWKEILVDYTSNDLTVGDIDSRQLSLQVSVNDYFVTPNGRNVHEVHSDGGVMQLAA